MTERNELSWDDDVFNHLKTYAENLTLYIEPTEKIEGINAINIDGGWGTGKTFFIKRWAQHLKERGHAVVEFNAWENDAAEDPLGPLLAHIYRYLEKYFPNTSRSEQVLEGIWKMGNALIQSTGKIVGTSILERTIGKKGTEIAVEMGKAALEDETPDFISQNGQKLEDEENLRASLRNLSEGFVGKSNADIPVWVFVDELDRCRPTFAIELLERIKHYFDMKEFVFVFATNTEQLAHSIGVIYGQEFKAHEYLQRFFGLTFPLPLPSSDAFIKKLFKSINFENTQWFGKPSMPISPVEALYFFSQNGSLSLRQQELAFRLLFNCIQILLAKGQKWNEDQVHALLLVYLICMQVSNPHLRISDRNILENLFDEKNIKRFSGKNENVFSLLCCYGDSLCADDESWSLIREGYENRSDDCFLEKMIFYHNPWVIEHVEVFKMTTQFIQRKEE